MKQRRSATLLLIVLLMQTPLQQALAALPVLPKFPPLVLKIPKPERLVLENGLVVFLLEDHELPLIQVSATFTSGTQYEPPEKMGLGTLFGDVLTHGGTLRQTPEVIEKILGQKAASIGFSVGLENGSGSMMCRATDFDSIFKLFIEMLREPRFRKDHLNLAKEKVLENLRRMNDDPDDMARREFRRLVYGGDHPYARIASPTTIRAIQRTDLLAWHQKFIHPNGLMLAISGDFESATLKTQLHQLLDSWPRQEIVLAPVPEPGTQFRSGLFFIRWPVNQSQIRIGALGIARHDPDHFAWEIFNELWGGGATSWLFSRVRTQMSLAYSVGSGYSEPSHRGMVVAVSQTRGSQTIAATQAILKIAEEIRLAPFSETDIRSAKEAIQNRFVQNFTSSAQIAQQVMQQEYFHFPPDYLETYSARIGKIERSDLVRVGQRLVNPQGSAILVVGDLSTFDKPLSSLGKGHEIKPIDYSEEAP